jgi:hypothetical protein
VILHEDHIAENAGKNRPRARFHRQNQQISAEKAPTGHFHPAKRVTLPMLRGLARTKIGCFVALDSLRAHLEGKPKMKAKPTALLVEDDDIQRAMWSACCSKSARCR